MKEHTHTHGFDVDGHKKEARGPKQLVVPRAHAVSLDFERVLTPSSIASGLSKSSAGRSL